VHQTFKKIILVAFTLVNFHAAAQVTEQSVTGEGSGITREHAIAAALTSAAGQAFGVAIDAATVSSSLAVEASTNEGSASLMVNQLNQVIAQRVTSPGNKPILGYTIGFANESAAGVWKAGVTMRYAQFKKMGGDSDRRSIVVTTNEKRYRDLLTTTVGQSVVASRRFDVLNRENSALFNQEAAFIQGSDAANAEVARLGQASGADYLVIAELQGLSLANNQRQTIQMTGEVLVRSSVSGMLKLQVVEFSSRKVKWSASEKFGGSYGGVSSISDETLIGLVSAASDKLVQKMIASIYPIMIVKVLNGTTAIVNRGEDSVKKGETYGVFLMGEELKDPQSGESLGALEVEVGIGTIVDVKPKVSTIIVKAGGLDPSPKTEYLLRPATAPAPAPQAAPAGQRAPAQPSQQDTRRDTFLR
jgi:hypothetical protein